MATDTEQEAQEARNPYPEYEGMRAVELARKMKAVDDELEVAAAKKSELQKRYDWLRNAQLPTQMETEGLENFRVDGVGRVSLSADMWVSIPAAKKDEFYDWLRANGRESIIVETVNSSTLKAMAKAAVKNGEPLPDGLLKVTPYTRAVITKI